MKTRKQRTDETRQQYLKAARKYCREQYNRLKEFDYPYNCHVSFYACDAMARTEKRFVDLGTFGTEGFCNDVGTKGITYLNTGDSYEPTILFDSDKERFFVASWGDIVENRIDTF